MRSTLVLRWLLVAALAATAEAQQATIAPQVRSKATADNKITEIELQAHFVTTIRVPEPVNSVVVGDPALFQVEHSEHEPELVFVKALTNEPAESNLLISTTRGRQISFLLFFHRRHHDLCDVRRSGQETGRSSGAASLLIRSQSGA